MKKNLLLAILVCMCTINLWAQPGILDPSFGTDGILNAPGTTIYGETAHAITFQSDGKILALGVRLGRACVKRYNEDGTADVSFGDQGEASNFVGFSTHSPKEIMIQPDGKIVVCGYLDTGYAFIMRFNTNGTPDSSFGTNGAASYHPSPSLFSRTLYPQDITVLSDGKIMIAGLVGVTSDSQWGIFALKINADGTPDTTYGYEGFFGEQPGGYPESAVCYPDGKVAFAILKSFPTFTGTYTIIKRFDQTGTGVLDATFGVSGITELTNGDLDYAIRDLKLQADGKLVGGGVSSTSETTGGEFTVMRLNYDGTPDASFGINGKVIPFNPGGEEIAQLAIHSDGSIIGAGPDASTYNFNVVRFSSGGMQDMSFGTNGVAQTSLGSYYHQVHDVAIQPDGKVIVTGMVVYPTASEYNYLLMRYLGSATTAGFKDNTLSQLSLYPNPASDVLYLANADELTIENLTVTDMAGKTVLAQTGTINQIDVQQLPDGLYFLNITTTGGTANLKFIKE